jgi:hypothetical protein
MNTIMRTASRSIPTASFLAASLLVWITALAQVPCNGSATITAGGSTTLGCPGPSQSKHQNYTYRGVVECNTKGYTSRKRDSGLLSKAIDESGSCNPDCGYSAISTSASAGTDGTLFTWDWTNGWNNGGSCGGAQPGHSEEPMADMGTCQGTYCCGASQANCTGNTTWNATSCSCGTDADSDGYSAPEDCNDSDASIYPGAYWECYSGMICPSSLDSDCNGATDCEECGASPILLDLDGNGITLTDAAHGVRFDLTGGGTPQQLAWTTPSSLSGWLALDRNGNGSIDDGSELFGNFTPQPPSRKPNGFLALAEFDKPAAGGNGDGLIDQRDAIYRQLRVWIDRNHDGKSSPDELLSLADAGVTALSLAYRTDFRRDKWGNAFLYRAQIVGLKEHWAYDVFLVSAPSSK